MEGWIKLHRELINKPIWKNSTPEQKSILITLLSLANHEQNEWEWMGEKFKVFPGQFATSLESIKQAAGKGISVQNVRSSLERFRKLQFLTYDSTKQGRIVTICNWDAYQNSSNKDQQSNQHRSNKEVTTNKNEIMKEIKNVISLYHDCCPNSPQIRKITKLRQSSIIARQKEYGKESVKEMFENASKSKFLQGNNDQKWVPTFDWLFSPRNFLKVLEGSYQNRKNRLPSSELSPAKGLSR